MFGIIIFISLARSCSGNSSSTSSTPRSYKSNSNNQALAVKLNDLNTIIENQKKQLELLNIEIASQERKISEIKTYTEGIEAKYSNASWIPTQIEEDYKSKVNEYNNSVNSYNTLLSQGKKLSGEYNDNVNKYNELLKSYNE